MDAGLRLDDIGSWNRHSTGQYRLDAVQAWRRCTTCCAATVIEGGTHLGLQEQGSDAPLANRGLFHIEY